MFIVIICHMKQEVLYKFSGWEIFAMFLLLRTFSQTFCGSVTKYISITYVMNWGKLNKALLNADKKWLFYRILPNELSRPFNQLSRCWLVYYESLMMLSNILFMTVIYRPYSSSSKFDSHLKKSSHFMTV